jgi:hypothetical protein
MDDLERDLLVEREVVGDVHGPHAALCEELDDVVAVCNDLPYQTMLLRGAHPELPAASIFLPRV